MNPSRLRSHRALLPLYHSSPPLPLPSLLHRHPSLSSITYRLFHPHPSQLSKPLPPRPTLPPSTLHHVFLKGSGPGGQKINKTNSAAQITHKPTGIVVKSQATRSQSQNYKIACRILAEKVEELEKGNTSRVVIKREIERGRKKSKEKKSRRKYRALKEGKGGDMEGGEAKGWTEWIGWSKEERKR